VFLLDQLEVAEIAAGCAAGVLVNFIYQRPTSTVGGVAGFIIVVNYGKHGRTFPTSAPTPVLIRPTGFSEHPREGAPTITRPRRGSSTSSDHCSLHSHL